MGPLKASEHLSWVLVLAFASAKLRRGLILRQAYYPQTEWKADVCTHILRKLSMSLEA